MEEVKFNALSYSKMMLHAAKYPHCAVNGVLLAEVDKHKDKKGKSITFVDTVPLFHLCLHVSPMAEVALMQIDAMAANEGLVIAGYYMANELIDDMSFDKPSTRIADKIADTFSSACLAVIDNRKLHMELTDASIRVLQNIEGKWKPLDETNACIGEKTLEITSILIQEESFVDLIDFDNHLDDLSLDWWNFTLNAKITKLMDEAVKLKR